MGIAYTNMLLGMLVAAMRLRILHMTSKSAALVLLDYYGAYLGGGVLQLCLLASNKVLYFFGRFVVHIV